MFNNFLYSLNDGITLAGGIISIIGTVVTLVSFFTDRNNRTGLKIFILFVSLGCFGISMYASQLIKVPNVTDIFYANACNLLSENGLRFNLEYDDGTLVVSDQYPKADEVVPKGSYVQLEVRNITEDIVRIERFYEKYVNKELLDVEIALFQKELEISDGMCPMYFGDAISYTEDMEIYLYVEDEDVILKEYDVLNDNTILFKGVPGGLKYSLYCQSNSYDVYKSSIMVSSSVSIDNRVKMDIHLSENDAELMFPCPIRIVDSNNNFMEDVKCDVGYKDSIGIIWSDGGTTDQSGYLGVTISSAEDTTVCIKVHDPYRNGVDFECEVPIKVARIGEAVDASIIKVYKDGKCKVMHTSEFYSW